LSISISSSYRLSAFLFSKAKKRNAGKEKVLFSRKEIVRCFRVMEIIGSGGCGAGTRRFVGALFTLSVGLRFLFLFLR
jgi:hypothetical protein